MTLENIEIKNIKNYSNYGSKICGNYNYKTSFRNSRNGFFGGDIRGVTVENCNNVSFKDLSLSNLKSESGNVIGLDVMFRSKNIIGNISTYNFKTVGLKYLPDGFNNIPQSPPFVNPFISNKESISSIIVKNIPNRNYRKISTDK